MAYAEFGNYLPGPIAHKGYSFWRLVNMVSVGTEGLFGSILGVSATYIAAFLIITAILQICGATKYFMKLAFSIAGNFVGGPAKVAVVSSALTGMITGSTVANVTATGSITIPLMKKVGYEKTFAGAVEAVASAGGSITPPIMGATAFIIADFLGISYWKVALSAAIPAILYYTSLFTAVHLRSIKLNMIGLNRNELPSFISSIKEAFPVLIPVGLLVYLLSLKYTALFAAFWTIVALLIMSSLKKDTRLSLSKLIKVCRLMAKIILPVSTACATAGIIVAMLNMTGLGQKLGCLVTTIASGRLLIAMFLTQIAALILGMGLVSPATYVLLAILCAPALIDMGASPISAHLFVYHFAILGTLTPPVCLAAYAAAGIAESNPLKTGVTAFRLAIPGFLVPYFFVMNPALIGQGTVLEVLVCFLTAAIGFVFFNVSIEGFLWKKLKAWERVLLMGGSIFLIYPLLIDSIIGFTIIAVALI